MSRSTPILQRISDSFFRHRLLFLLVVLIVSAITIVAISLRSKQYVAAAQTQVLADDVATALGVSDRTDYISPAQKNVNHFNDLINDDLPNGFLDIALKRANLSVPIDLNPRDNDPHYTQLRKHLTASPESDSLFSISLTWDNPKDCESIVAALQQQYIEEVGSDRAAGGIRTGQLLDSQIREYATRMRQAEQALIQYKEANSGKSPEQQSADLGQLSSLQQQLDNLKISMEGVVLQRQNIETQLKKVNPLSVREQTSQQSPYGAKIRLMQMERDARVAGGMLPTHPIIVNLDKQIAILQKEWPKKVSMSQVLQDNPLYQTLQQQLVQAKNYEFMQSSQMANLEKEIAQYQDRAKKIPEEQRQLTDKTRDYQVLTTQYNNLKARREEIRIKTDLDKVSASSTLNRIGWIYAEPVTTRTKLILLIIGSIFLGLLVGSIIVVLYEWGDNSLRYPLDSERLLGVPVLAVLPETADLRYYSTPPALTGGGKKLLSAPADNK